MLKSSRTVFICSCRRFCTAGSLRYSCIFSTDTLCCFMVFILNHWLVLLKATNSLTIRLWVKAQIINLITSCIHTLRSKASGSYALLANLRSTISYSEYIINGFYLLIQEYAPRLLAFLMAFLSIISQNL